MKKVLLAMSGGIDSSVSAHILKKSGFFVIGVTFKLFPDENYTKLANNTANFLGIEHHILDYSKEFELSIINYFISSYKNGMTPNPCVLCNRNIKFRYLIELADKFDINFIATGHYVKLSKNSLKKFILSKPKDLKKDQTYFLSNMDGKILNRCIFPLSDILKTDVKDMAKKIGLKNNESESQEICFIKNNKYYKYIESRFDIKKDGFFIEKSSGVKLSKHKGIHRYTVGQRKRLGNIPTNKRLYVLNINSKTGDILLGSKKDLEIVNFYLKSINWINKSYYGIYLDIMVRYRSELILGKINQIEKSKFLISLKTPAPWISPGQAVAFYQGQILLGGGIIDL